MIYYDGCYDDYGKVCSVCDYPIDYGSLCLDCEEELHGWFGSHTTA